MDLLRYTSEIIGILFAGVLTALAIIFGFLRYEEFEYGDEGLENIKKYFNNLKKDFQCIFVCFIIAIFIYIANPLLFIDSILEFENINEIHLFIQTFFELFLITVSLSSTYDVVTGLFEINDIKYKNFEKKKKE
ncbi:hypothetical protein [Methanimicrococcus hacksteinii]|uniref:hypothetical protein n=1 Tax=Methanimicrococcus hacksteinii TaxID=3028293 RepID=UPI00298F30BD|nr:hypothetical protein [Methanimicrococcus sp. At1]